jgi:hypothetical protein
LVPKSPLPKAHESSVLPRCGTRPALSILDPRGAVGQRPSGNGIGITSLPAGTAMVSSTPSL